MTIIRLRQAKWWWWWRDYDDKISWETNIYKHLLYIMINKVRSSMMVTQCMLLLLKFWDRKDGDVDGDVDGEVNTDNLADADIAVAWVGWGEWLARLESGVGVPRDICTVNSVRCWCSPIQPTLTHVFTHLCFTLTCCLSKYYMKTWINTAL